MERYWMDRNVEDLGKTLRAKLEQARKEKKKAEERKDAVVASIWAGAVIMLELLEPKVEAVETEWSELKKDEENQ